MNYRPPQSDKLDAEERQRQEANAAAATMFNRLLRAGRGSVGVASTPPEHQQMNNWIHTEYRRSLHDPEAQ